LSQALGDLGIALEGKTPLEISETLTETLCGPQSTMDDIAIHNAMSELTAELLGKATELQQFEASLAKAASSVPSTLVNFFGKYIHQRFCALSYANILAKLGAQKTEAAMAQIKTFIASKVSALAADRNLAKINWKGKEGLNIVDQIRIQTEEVFSV